MGERGRRNRLIDHASAERFMAASVDGPLHRSALGLQGAMMHGRFPGMGILSVKVAADESCGRMGQATAMSVLTSKSQQEQPCSASVHPRAPAVCAGWTMGHFAASGSSIHAR